MKKVLAILALTAIVAVASVAQAATTSITGTVDGANTLGNCTATYGASLNNNITVVQTGDCTAALVANSPYSIAYQHVSTTLASAGDSIATIVETTTPAGVDLCDAGTSCWSYKVTNNDTETITYETDTNGQGTFDANEHAIETGNVTVSSRAADLGYYSGTFVVNYYGSSDGTEEADTYSNTDGVLTLT